MSCAVDKYRRFAPPRAAPPPTLTSPTFSMPWIRSNRSASFDLCTDLCLLSSSTSPYSSSHFFSTPLHKTTASLHPAVASLSPTLKPWLILRSLATARPASAESALFTRDIAYSDISRGERFGAWDPGSCKEEAEILLCKGEREGGGGAREGVCGVGGGESDMTTVGIGVGMGRGGGKVRERKGRERKGREKEV